MSYHRFPNISEILQFDLVGKLREGIGSKDFLNRECNFSYTTKVIGECAYEGDCRECCVVYNATCKLYILVYVGNNQNTLKENGTTFPRFGAKSTAR